MRWRRAQLAVAQGEGRGGATARRRATSSPSVPRASRPAAPWRRSPNRPDRVWQSHQGNGGAPDPAALEGARRGRLPKELAPELATLVDAAPPGDDWLHEIKLDGYRTLCRLQSGRARLITRRGNDWTDRFGRVASRRRLPAGCARRCSTARSWSLQPDGTTSFQSLQQALGAGDDRDLFYFVFDLLYLDGFDLRRAPLVGAQGAAARPARRRAGRRSSACATATTCAAMEHELFAEACEHALEGIVSKQADVPLPRRAPARLAEGEVPAAPGAGDRRLHRPRGLAQRLRLAAARGPRRGRAAALRREGGHRLRRRRRCARCTSACRRWSSAAHRSTRRCRRARAPGGPTGSRRACSPRSRSPSGPTKGCCATRRSRVCATTRRRGGGPRAPAAGRGRGSKQSRARSRREWRKMPESSKKPRAAAAASWHRRDRDRRRARHAPGPRALPRPGDHQAAAGRSTTSTSPRGCCRISRAARSPWCAARRAREGVLLPEAPGRGGPGDSAAGRGDRAQRRASDLRRRRLGGRAW